MLKFLHRLLVPAVALAALSAGMSSNEANAQLAAGCSCPSGDFESGGSCYTMDGFEDAPICTKTTSSSSPGVGDVARSVSTQQMQLSFSNLSILFEHRRDLLQGRRSISTPLGYASEDGASQILGYASTRRPTDAFASIYNKAPAHAALTGPIWASWIEGMGDWQKNSAVNAFDTDHSTDTYGVQGGVDTTWRGLKSSDDALITGLIASWMTSRVTYNGSPTSLRMEGPGVGLYTTYIKGFFSTDLAVKGDFLSLDQSYGALLPNTSFNLTNLGVSGNVQYKFMAQGNSYVEPTAGFSFTRVMFDNSPATQNLSDANTVRIQAGARFGTSWSSNGMIVEPSIKLLAYDNVVADGSSSVADATAALIPNDANRVRGQIDPQVNFDMGNGLSSNLSGSVRFGDNVVGGAVRAQVRKQW